MLTGCPLAVRLSSGSRDQHVTLATRSLSFTKTAPGGHKTASVNLVLDRASWSDLGDSDRLFFYDRVTGRPIFDGYTNLPGATDGVAGQAFDLTAKGGADRLLDDRRALVYVDQASQNWAKNATAQQPASLRADWAPQPGSGAQGILDGFPPGQPVATNDVAQMAYQFQFSDMEFGAIGFTVTGGVIDANYAIRADWSGVSNGGTNMATLTTTPLNGGGYVNDGTFPATGTTGLGLTLIRTGGATNITTDLVWAHYAALRILGRRMDQLGTLVSGSSGMVRNTYVLASEVVADLLGRMMPWADGGGAQIDVTTTQIDQLAYYEAASVEQVVDDLGLWEPDAFLEVLHVNASGKHQVNYRMWPTSARYEISTRDGYTQPGSDQGLCNRVIVSWTDPTGAPKTTLVTAKVPALDDISRIRHATGISLPAGKGSLANALAIGAQVLDDINASASSARAVVARRVLDLQEGRLVSPWEIEPGYLVRVRDTGGVQRLSQVDYEWSQDGTSQATLALGTPPLTLAQMLQRLTKKAGGSLSVGVQT